MCTGTSQAYRLVKILMLKKVVSKSFGEVLDSRQDDTRQRGRKI